MILNGNMLYYLRELFFKFQCFVKIFVYLLNTSVRSLEWFIFLYIRSWDRKVVVLLQSRPLIRQQRNLSLSVYHWKGGQPPSDQHKVDLAFFGNIPNLCTWHANVDYTFMHGTYIVSVSGCFLEARTAVNAQVSEMKDKYRELRGVLKAFHFHANFRYFFHTVLSLFSVPYQTCLGVLYSTHITGVSWD